MGLLAKLLLFPITAPVYGLGFIAEQIKEQVDAEQLDEDLVEEELMTLTIRYELGEIGDASYVDQETALLEHLNAIRTYKESLADTSDEDAADDVADAPEAEPEMTASGRETASHGGLRTTLSAPTRLRDAS